MNIKTKYDIGERVHIIKQDFAIQEEVCPVCDSKGCFKYRGHILECSLCHGRGKIFGERKYQYYVSGDQYEIKGFSIKKTNNELVVICHLSNYGSLNEDMCFVSGEEAITRCQELNDESPNLGASDTEDEKFYTFQVPYKGKSYYEKVVADSPEGAWAEIEKKFKDNSYLLDDNLEHYIVEDEL